MDVNLIQNASDILQLAVMMCDRPPKQLAADIGYSVEAVRAAMAGTKSIPIKARKRISGINIASAMAVAMESTGLGRLFGYHDVDRHLQSMILRMREKDKASMVATEELPLIVLDKETREQLDPGDLEKIEAAVDVLVDKANFTINLIMELESKYRLETAGKLQKEKRPPGAGTPNGPLVNQQQDKYIIRKIFRQRGEVTP